MSDFLLYLKTSFLSVPSSIGSALYYRIGELNWDQQVNVTHLIFHSNLLDVHYYVSNKINDILLNFSSWLGILLY